MRGRSVWKDACWSRFGFLAFLVAWDERDVITDMRSQLDISYIGCAIVYLYQSIESRWLLSRSFLITIKNY